MALPEGIDRLPPGQAREFNTTHWSVVLQAADAHSPLADSAMEQLCRHYWYPLYVYARRLGRSAHDAQDLTQDFFARLIERKSLGLADPQRGRFRTFLLSSFKNFMASEWKKAQAKKRGNGQVLFSLDVQDSEQRYACDAVENSTPEHAFAKRWAATLLELVMSQLRRKYSTNGKTNLFEILQCHIWSDPAEVRYAAFTSELGMSEGAARVAMCRLREDFRSMLRAEVASTVETDAEVDEELRYLISVLRT
jgi:RNA polymerase sigma factor (sigma-70 family)